jgi:glycerate-2-kinase
MKKSQQNQWKDKLIDAILDAADPIKCVEILFEEGKETNISINQLKKQKYKHFHIISIGKAAVTMAQGLINVFSDDIEGGVIIHKSDYVVTPDEWHKRFMILGSSHPVPDERSLEAAKAVIHYLSGLEKDDFVYFLISGGGSALVTLPESGISLTDLMKMNRLLLECGADINDINCIRKHIDQVKGGKLINRTLPAGFCTLILSDVLGNPVDVIASGPTVPDSSTFEDAWKIISKYNLIDQMPAGIVNYLEEGKKALQPETIKLHEIPENYTDPLIIGSNKNSLVAAQNCAAGLGLYPVILTDHLVGEVGQAAKWIIRSADSYMKENTLSNANYCFLCGGETTVVVHGNGLGGRNLELALSAVDAIAEMDNAFFVSFGTDGEDGPTDAAGAWVDTDTKNIAAKADLSVSDYLERNDSYHFFEKIKQLIKTGSSGTNVNDVCFLIVEMG